MPPDKDTDYFREPFRSVLCRYKLVGSVPSFSFVVSLRVLRLGSNQFTGSLPEALIQESSMVLSELDLSLNQLQGIFI